MTRNYQTRLFLSYLLALGLTLAVMLPLGLWRLRSFGEEQLTGQLKAQARLLAVDLRPLLAPGRKAGDPVLTDFARQAGQVTGCRLTLIAADGRVLADSEVPDAELARVENHGTRQEVLQARSEGFGTSVRRSATVGRDLLYLALAIDRGAYLRLAMPLHSVQDLSWQLREALLAAVVVAVLLGGVFSYFLARRQALAVKTLSDAAARVAEGAFELDLAEGQGTELDGLAASLKAMSARLKEGFTGLRRRFDLPDEEHKGVVDGQRR